MAKNVDPVSKLDVFISYSRSDMVFADRLVAALEARGFKCLIDRRDLEYGEKWQAVLRDFIQQSDTVVFAVSPRSINSQWCRWELAEVARLSKRLVPIVLESVPGAELPPEIGAVHLMPFDGGTRFDDDIASLERVLLTDRAWVREHTRLSMLASKWAQGGRNRDGLLRGSELGEAEAWKGRPTRDGLPPNPLVEAYISEGRGNAIRVQRTRTRVSTAITLGALMLSGVAIWQGWLAQQSQQEAVKQRDVAKQQRDQALLIQSQFLADAATAVVEQDKDPGTALRLALEALPDTASKDEVTKDRPFWAPAAVALDAALRQLRESIVLTGHTATVNKALMSRDGRRAVTASADGTARIWDPDSGAELLRLVGHSGGISSLLFTPDGRSIVTGSDNPDHSARIWNASTGAEQARFVGHTGSIAGLAVSPDGTRVATGSFDTTARIWDAKSGALQLLLRGHTGWVNAIVFAPDGTRVYTASEDKTVRIWDARTGAQLGLLNAGGTGISMLLMSPDGSRLVTGERLGSPRVWDAKAATLLFALKSPDEAISAVAMSADGARLATGHNGGEVGLWDARTGTEIARMKGHTGVLHAMAFSQDGTRLATGDWNNTARVWDAKTGAELMVLAGQSG